MTVASVRKAISVFLSTSTPQVLCIRGKWGVGKTFIWNDVFNHAKANGKVALYHYCYVFLFGLQSVDEVRQSIFENRVSTSETQVEASFESIKENVKRLGDIAAQQASRFSSYAKIPYLDNYIANVAGGFRQIVALAVRDTIICFDDFERKKLSTKDLLGLISQVREQRRCKAVILLNEDALYGEEKEDFRRYFEKVVDIPIEFAPTPAECADIIVKGDDLLNAEIRKNAVTLGISNIRILIRVKVIATELLKTLDSFGDDVKRQALHTLTLFLWSKYDDEAVPMTFITGLATRPLEYLGEKERTDDERKWGPKLESYGFRYCDTFDVVILQGVERGFFDEEEVVKEAADQTARYATSASKNAIQQVWQRFHSSLADNATQEVNAIHDAYKTHIQVVSRGNLDEAVCLFKRLGFPAEASNLITAYVDFNKNNVSAVDQPSPFFSTVKDEEFRAALASVVVPPKPKSLKESLIAIGTGSYQMEDGESVLTLSEDDFYKIFKEAAPDELNLVIEGSLFWRRITNAKEAERDMIMRALAALEKIGDESTINAVRMEKYIRKITSPYAD